MSAGPPQLFASLAVALGGGIGALLRYQLGRAMTHWLGPTAITTFPFATLAVNTIGSLAMGLLAGYLAYFSAPGGEQARLLLGVGLLGGFTTFSAFSLEMVMMIERGQYLFALVYLSLSIGLALTGFIMGLNLMRIIG